MNFTEWIIVIILLSFLLKDVIFYVIAKTLKGKK